MIDSFANVIVLALRIGVVVILYTFIILVFRALCAELRAVSRSPNARSFEPSEWLEVVDCDGATGMLFRNGTVCWADMTTAHNRTRSVVLISSTTSMRRQV